MKLLPMDKLGSHELNGNKIHFGMLLPWVSKQNGNRLFVKIINEEDQFIKNIDSNRFELAYSTLPVYGDYWSGEVSIDKSGRKSPLSKWGEKGRYIYRYELESPLLSKPLDWIVDPFAREFGIGRQAAITLGYKDHNWGDIETTWKTPKLSDLVAYEIMLHEFATDLKGATEKLTYLKDLGINCIEIMPVSNVYRSIDWGFEPIGPFGLDERFGRRKDFQQFVQTAHENGIAVILDMIYGHTGNIFAYEYVYSNLRYNQNPFMGPFAKDMFGPSTDYNKEFTQDFYFTVNHFWLDRYHVDGIRYDCVPNYYDGYVGVGYANLVYSTYQEVKQTAGSGHWQRFFNSNRVNLIQCAEQLEAPKEIVEKTYSNCTWQNETLGAANEVAQGNFSKLYELGMQFGLDGYTMQVTQNSDVIDKSAFQYLENHDHPRFICSFGTDSLYKEVFKEGKRENWFKLQPYVIGLMLAKGIPMLWQGQEIVENYDVPDYGPARIGTLRPVRWELFYTDEGRSMIALYRKLIALRNNEDVFRQGAFYFFNDWNEYQSKGILLFRRTLNNVAALVALNFTMVEQTFSFRFDSGGNYIEQLHQADNQNNVKNDEVRTLKVPANYGKIWLKK
jgi:maltooligosyltrehalose trehalohydrolase